MKLDENNIPESFRFLAPCAEEWGIVDPVELDNRISNATTHKLIKLVTIVGSFDEALDEWLAGSEVDLSPPSREYIAFTVLRLAVDMAKLTLEQRGKQVI